MTLENGLAIESLDEQNFAALLERDFWNHEIPTISAGGTELRLVATVYDEDSGARTATLELSDGKFFRVNVGEAVDDKSVVGIGTSEITLLSGDGEVSKLELYE